MTYSEYYLLASEKHCRTVFAASANFAVKQVMDDDVR